jgi:glutathione S-transferase
MLKIYGRKNSINVQKVLWTVAEIGLDHERIDAGMAFGVVNEPWFRALNPNGLVPTIDDDGAVVWESNAIVRYLAAKYAPGKLIPTDPAARANVEMWMDWQQSTIMPGLGPVFLGLIRTPPEKRDMTAIRAGEESVLKGLRMLDQHLAHRAHIAGDHLTVADIPLGAAAYRWYALPIQRPALPHLRKWYERLVPRPGFAEHIMQPLT